MTIGANMKVGGVGGVATTCAPVEAEADSVAWFGGLGYETKYVPTRP